METTKKNTKENQQEVWERVPREKINILGTEVEVMQEMEMEVALELVIVSSFRYKCPGKKRATIAREICHHMNLEEKFYCCEYGERTMCLDRSEEQEEDMLQGRDPEAETTWRDQAITRMGTSSQEESHSKKEEEPGKK
jgi:hypothetical protein